MNCHFRKLHGNKHLLPCVRNIHVNTNKHEYYNFHVCFVHRVQNRNKEIYGDSLGPDAKWLFDRKKRKNKYHL